MKVYIKHHGDAALQFFTEINLLALFTTTTIHDMSRNAAASMFEKLTNKAAETMTAALHLAVENNHVESK